jgi:hypothetical protein
MANDQDMAGRSRSHDLPYDLMLDTLAGLPFFWLLERAAHMLEFTHRPCATEHSIAYLHASGLWRRQSLEDCRNGGS